MTAKMTRREFLVSAGGVTFLALLPVGRGLFAAPDSPDVPQLPLFTVTPYIQPGSNSKLAEGQESMIVAWQTLGRPAQFTVDYGTSKSYGSQAEITSGDRYAGNPGNDGEGRLNYSAALTSLKLNTTYYYRVSGNGQKLAEGYVTTRKPRGHRTRFVTFGDNSFGDISDRAIAYQAYQQHPDFVMNTGDNVYDSGLDNEYARYFFPVYNADVAGSRLGAPLLRSVPFYTVMANHDVHGKDANHHPAADFALYADALAYYTAMHLPLNGPELPPNPTPIVGPADRLTGFRQCAGPRFPRMANYSYDYGDAHFLCLDSNDYIDPTNADLQSWIASDLGGTDASWKFVVFHHPGFNVGQEHYTEQHMRVLSPLFEKHGVDFVLHGHEHTYQRTMPLLFAPTNPSQTGEVGTSKRLVPGTFTLDQTFDGKTNTHPKGIIYVTTGAGGKHLYEPGYTNNPADWVHPEDNNIAYVAKFISDRHSLTVFELDGKTLTLSQIDEDGQEIDHIRVTKA